MSSKTKHIMIVAGEVSGDIHAASLVRELKHLDPSLTFSGLGGMHLAQEGVQLYEDLTKMAVIGFVEVIKHFWELRRLFYLFLEYAVALKPAVVILVDYPGFNLRLAKALKKHGIKVIYYVSPQIWAWKEKRIELIKKVTDRMLVFFDFEKEFYEERGMYVDFVGHPLIDHIHINTSRHDLLASKGLNPNNPTIGIIPGSRDKEIETLLPAMVEAAGIIMQRIPNVQFLLTKAANISIVKINKHVLNRNIPIAVIENEFHNTIHACDICMVTSGTATLETALLEKPMVIVYKTSWITYMIGRLLVKIKWIGLANIISQKDIVPECIQAQATGPAIAHKLLELYTDPFKMETTINELKEVKKKLGGSGASRRAAEIVMKEIS
ncbi:MAG TPA: lipid-A-disaccharide synthase [Candidatus Bathyarchaeia archaeon]|nr:lipid-A-disaccharide synthase [Candidatus Bathyarchaeia archaeon]